MCIFMLPCAIEMYSITIICPIIIIVNFIPKNSSQKGKRVLVLTNHICGETNAINARQSNMFYYEKWLSIIKHKNDFS
jgi:hypothetical protein